MFNSSRTLAEGHSTSAAPSSQMSAHRRRHSSHQPLPRNEFTIDSDTVFLKVDLFIFELERRLDWIESYSNLNLDNSLCRAYQTLDSIRQSCSHASGELVGAGRRRARILVETVEERYQNALEAKGSLEAKAQAGMRMLEARLSDLEARAIAFRHKDFSDVIDEGWRMAGDGVQKAKEVVDEGRNRARRAKESLKESIDFALQRAKDQRLISYDDLPHPWRINPYITSGYRFSGNKMDCFKSAFNYSNETVNIWSHMIGVFIVLAVAFHFYPASVNFSRSTKADTFVAALFFFAACKTLLCSTMYHTMNSISNQTLLDRFACVDYTGISLLIGASIITGEYTAFYCQPVSRYIYVSMTAILGIAGVLVPWHPTFNRADMAWARVAFYVSLAATGFAPFVQLCATRGSLWTWTFYSPVLKSVAVYLAGSIAYASKVPERWLQGWFDFIGGSHQIWHMAVLGGILYHYSAMQSFFSMAFQMGEVDCRPDLFLQSS